MKKLKVSLAVLLLFISSQNVTAQRVVILGLDGFSAEAFNKIKHPNIDQLLAQGLISVTTRPVMPSVTLPNWTSHLTGSGPEEHGITSNNWTLTDHPLKAIEIDEDGYSPSIFKVLKTAKPKAKTAFYYNWPELINPFNKKYIDEVSFEENDSYTKNYQKAIDFIAKNQQSPTLVFLYSVHTDHVGHANKWMSVPYIAAVEEADKAIGDFVDQLKKENLFEDTYFLLITDHGGIESGHGGVTMNEMQVPWGITGPKIKKLGLTDAFYNSNKNTSLVISKIFGLKELPKSWTGVASKEIFR
ncbi:Type I phosphodiesterase / nucleotide pyrophosphatase [compost metagenome]